MTCAGALSLVSRHRDGALPAAEATALETHLAGCPDCVRWGRWIDRASRAAAAALGAEMPAELAAEALEFAQHLVATRR